MYLPCLSRGQTDAATQGPCPPCCQSADKPSQPRGPQTAASLTGGFCASSSHRALLGVTAGFRSLCQTVPGAGQERGRSRAKEGQEPGRSGAGAGQEPGRSGVGAGQRLTGCDFLGVSPLRSCFLKDSYAAGSMPHKHSVHLP